MFERFFFNVGYYLGMMIFFVKFIFRYKSYCSNQNDTPFILELDDKELLDETGEYELTLDENDTTLEQKIDVIKFKP